MKKLFAACAALALSFTLVACEDDAKVASRNLSKAADNFEIPRRIIFYNGINGEYIMTIEGFCSLENASTGPRTIAITCKRGRDDIRKHFLGLSDNVTFFAEQLEAGKVSVNFFRVTFKPTTIIPDIDLRLPQ